MQSGLQEAESAQCPGLAFQLPCARGCPAGPVLRELDGGCGAGTGFVLCSAMCAGDPPRLRSARHPTDPQTRGPRASGVGRNWPLLRGAVSPRSGPTHVSSAVPRAAAWGRRCIASVLPTPGLRGARGCGPKLEAPAGCIFFLLELRPPLLFRKP